MKIIRRTNNITIQRDTDNKIYQDSTVWYHMMKEINKQCDLNLIVASHEKDGNLYGDIYYLRSSMKDIRKGKPYYSIYDTEYALRDLKKAYNDNKEITFPFRME